MTISQNGLLIALAWLLAGTGSAQAIRVGPGQTLTEADLDVGTFNGQAFTLGAETIFDIDGGTIGPVGSTIAFPARDYDLGGSAVLLRDGGTFAAFDFDGSSLSSSIANARVVAEAGGTIQGLFTANAGVSVTIEGGTLREDATFRFGSRLIADSGIVGARLQLQSGASFTMNGGETVGPATATDAEVILNGGSRGWCLLTGSARLTINGGRHAKQDAHDESALLIAGGRVFSIGLHDHAAATIVGGVLPTAVLDDSSVITIRGGLIGSTRISEGALQTISGNGFRFNGLHLAGSSPELREPGLLTGVLEDGTVFALDIADPAATMLDPVQIPGPGSPVIDVTDGVFSTGARPGQTVNLRSPGELEEFCTFDRATLNAQGGILRGEGIRLAQSDASLSGMTEGAIEARQGSTVTLHDGFLTSIDASDSDVRINDGRLFGCKLVAGSLFVAGGTVNNVYSTDAELMIAGGSVGVGHLGTLWSSGGRLELVAGELGRVEAEATDIRVTGGLVTDAISLRTRQRPHSVEIERGSVEAIVGILSSASIYVRGGSVNVINLNRNLGDIIVTGGEISNLYNRASDRYPSSLIVRGGIVGFVSSSGGAAVFIEGGEIPGGVAADGPTAVRAGQIAAVFQHDSGTLSITGGRVSGTVSLLGDSATISGGTVDEPTRVDTDLLLIARNAEIAGVPVVLPMGEPVTIEDRNDEQLRVTLEDGSEFRLTLTSGSAAGITPEARIRIVVADTSCPADVNLDGTLTPADFSAWVLAFQKGSPFCDQNGDVLCTPADFSAWILNYKAGCN